MNVQTTRAGLEENLANLREGFLERVAERCLAIEAIVVDASKSGAQIMTDEDRAEIAHFAHKTAGVAATLGFPVLGQRALDVEQLLGRPVDILSWQAVGPEIEALLDEMERALDA